MKIVHKPTMILAFGILAATAFMGCGASIENSHLETVSEMDGPGMSKPYTSRTSMTGNANLASIGVPMGAGGVGYGAGVGAGYGPYGGLPFAPPPLLASYVAIDYAPPASPGSAGGTPQPAGTSPETAASIDKLEHDQHATNVALKMMAPINVAYCKEVLSPDDITLIPDADKPAAKKACRKLLGKEHE